MKFEILDASYPMHSIGVVGLKIKISRTRELPTSHPWISGSLSKCIREKHRLRKIASWFPQFENQCIDSMQ